MLFERYLENLTIYGENLPIFYVACAVISFVAVWFTWNTEPKSGRSSDSKESEAQTSASFAELSTDNNEEFDDPSEMSFTKKKNLTKAFAEELSSHDRAMEREIERQQLKDILNILKNDEKFNVKTMEELQEQLKLYRD